VVLGGEVVESPVQEGVLLHELFHCDCIRCLLKVFLDLVLDLSLANLFSLCIFFLICLASVDTHNSLGTLLHLMLLDSLDIGFAGVALEQFLLLAPDVTLFFFFSEQV